MTKHVSRRAALAASAAVPLAAVLPDLAPVAEAAIAPAAESPLDVVSWSFSMIDEHADCPLFVRLRDGSCRLASMDELRDHLDGWPFGCERTSPATLRALFPDGDGELLATLKETREAGNAAARAQHRGEPSPEAEAAYRACLNRLAEVRVRTPGGAMMLFDWYRSEVGFGDLPLTREQHYAILGRIACVNYHNFDRREGARYLSKAVAREWGAS